MALLSDPSTPPGFIDMDSSGHSNLYVKNLPGEVDEATLHQLFSPFGQVECCRIVKNARTEASKGYGFVKMISTQQAQDAIKSMNGYNIRNCVLEVKFADADAGPPASGSGGTPTNNVYVRNLPPTWSEQELLQLFAPYGTVQECRVLHAGDLTRGAGALVRLNSVEEAAHAIEALNNRPPVPGSALPLLVRFADSPEEKARKLAKKDRAQQPRFNPYDPTMPPASVSRGDSPLFASSLPAGFTAFNASGLPDSTGGRRGQHMLRAQAASLYASDPGVGVGLGMPPLAPQNGGFTPSDVPGYDAGMHGMSSLYPGQGPSGGGGNGLVGPPAMMAGPQGMHSAGAGPPALAPSSLYIKNLPPDADKLYLYERFAPHGAVLSVKVLVDDQTGKCRGVGFVNYADPNSALSAIQGLHGIKVGDKLLHVSLQTHRSQPRSAS